LSSNGGQMKLIADLRNLKLIPDWPKFYKLWSVRLTFAGSIITSVLIAFPEAAISVWLTLPSDIRDALPPQFVPFLGVAIVLSSIFARVVQQPKLKEKAPEDD
jgi:hypothetical protein